MCVCVSLSLSLSLSYLPAALPEGRFGRPILCMEKTQRVRKYIDTVYIYTDIHISMNAVFLYVTPRIFISIHVSTYVSMYVYCFMYTL